MIELDELLSRVVITECSLDVLGGRPVGRERVVELGLVGKMNSGPAYGQVTTGH